MDFNLKTTTENPPKTLAEKYHLDPKKKTLSDTDKAIFIESFKDRCKAMYGENSTIYKGLEERIKNTEFVFDDLGNTTAKGYFNPKKSNFDNKKYSIEINTHDWDKEKDANGQWKNLEEATTIFQEALLHEEEHAQQYQKKHDILHKNKPEKEAEKEFKNFIKKPPIIIESSALKNGYNAYGNFFDEKKFKLFEYMKKDCNLLKTDEDKQKFAQYLKDNKIYGKFYDYSKYSDPEIESLESE